MCSGICGISLISLVGGTTTALAQQTITSPPLIAANDQGDWASSLFDFVFHGEALPPLLAAYAARTAPLAEALRHALTTYSTAMLAVAGFVLFYHLVTIIVETAHTGVVMGRRTNQVWAPIRLVVAILLLVPVGELSGGHYIVLKIAKIGSGIANRAWDVMANAAGQSLATLVTPQSPPAATLVTRAIEVELCHQIYDSLYASQAASTPIARIVGSMGDFIKTPASPLTPETWRLTNGFASNAALCGAYRFSGYRTHSTPTTPSTDTLARVADDLTTFSHTEAESLSTQAHALATRLAPTFTDKDQPPAPMLQEDIAALIKSINSDVAAHLHTITAINTPLAQRLITQPGDNGWIAAGMMLPALLHMQVSYGELVDHMLPTIDAPQFNHVTVSRRVIDDILKNNIFLAELDHDLATSLIRFHGHVGAAMERAHNWFYATQLPADSVILIDDFDLRDHMGSTTTLQETNAVTLHAFDQAAIAYGVWGKVSDDTDNRAPFSTPNRERSHNPFSSSIEFGRRQLALGSYGAALLSGGLLTTTSATLPLTLTLASAWLISLGGIALMFIVPLLPFFRFISAVLVWLLEIVEALAAIPLVAIAHLNPTGDGLSGSTARQAYRLWFSIAVRPVLTLIGFGAGFVLFALGTTLLEIALLPLARLSSITNNVTFMIANCGTIIAFDVLTLALVNVAFKGVHAMPEHALRWLTPLVTGEANDSAPPANTPTPASPAPNNPTLSMLSHLASRVRESTTTQDKSAEDHRLKTSLFPDPLRNKGDEEPSDTAALPPPSESDKASGTPAMPNNVSADDKIVERTAVRDTKTPAPSSGKSQTAPYSNKPFFPDKNKPNA